MKSLFSFLFCFFSIVASAQMKESRPDSLKKLSTVEASCGQCKLGMKGKGCTLAIRIEGKTYFVDGTAIDEHGDAHADDGFCNKIRKANVQGEVVDGRFKASYFKLLPETSKKG